MKDSRVPTTLNGFPVLDSIARPYAGSIHPTFYVMVFRPGNYMHPFVIATWNQNCEDEWVSGDYYAEIDAATGEWASIRDRRTVHAA